MDKNVEKSTLLRRDHVYELISKVLYDAQQTGYCKPNEDMDLRKKAEWLNNWLKENVK